LLLAIVAHGAAISIAVMLFGPGYPKIVYDAVVQSGEKSPALHPGMAYY
jgi:hypothetical protein